MSPDDPREPLLLMKAVFRDRRGEEQIEFRSTGSSLETVIRGIPFAGSGFDSLSPMVETDQFDLAHGDLCACSLDVAIPVRLRAPEGPRVVELVAETLLGSLAEDGGLDCEEVRVSLRQPEFFLQSRGDSGGFEDEILSLASRLPAGFAMEICLTCGLSDYSPYGHGIFGDLACFRDAADDYRQVSSKAGIFAIWERLTKFVQETHRCGHYESRIPGSGYRG